MAKNKHLKRKSTAQLKDQQKETALVEADDDSASEQEVKIEFILSHVRKIE